jgi:glycyl-tRNA synthetase
MSDVNKQQGLMEKLTALAKRRGFIYQSSEIYGGINGFWDYGPLGVELKRNVKNAWWHDMVTTRDDMVGLDCSIIMNPRVWEASGHLGGFADPMVDCKQCKGRFRADKVWAVKVQSKVGVQSLGFEADDEAHAREAAAPAIAKIAKKQGAADIIEVLRADITLAKPDAAADFACPSCGQVALMPARKFNLMFKTYVGAIESEDSVAYLRPETAQGIFANFKNVVDTSRVKLPFGIAQIGKSFRNEINPRNYTFRSREFEQMEIEFFCKPGESAKWYEYWRDLRHKWYTNLGLKSSKLHLREHDKEELAHYAAGCADVEYEFPFGTSELEGIANRGSYDLTRHQEFSGKDLSYFDDEAKERFIPHVVEPSAGVDRTCLALLCEAYDEDEIEGEKRTLMRFHPRIAPLKAAVFPLVRKEGMPEVAEAIYRDLKSSFPVYYDEKGAIGRRYRRQDEAGTPFCITVDGVTLQDQTVTVRDRDTLTQVRIDKSRCLAYLKEKMGMA